MRTFFIMHTFTFLFDVIDWKSPIIGTTCTPEQLVKTKHLMSLCTPIITVIRSVCVIIIIDVSIVLPPIIIILCLFFFWICMQKKLSLTHHKRAFDKKNGKNTAFTDFFRFISLTIFCRRSEKTSKKIISESTLLSQNYLPWVPRKK